MLLYNIEDMNKIGDFDSGLVLEYQGFFTDINEIETEIYIKYPVIKTIYEDLTVIYKRIEEHYQKFKKYELPKQPLKKASKISDSNIQIIMNPFPGKKSNNEIIINNQQYAKVQNSPFELLYYLLWFRKNYPDESTGLEINGVIPSDHINEITNNDDKLNRFSAAWNDKINSRMRNEKSKTVSKINALLKTRHKIDFDAIVEDGEYYKLTTRFKPDNIELIPFQANI